MTNAILLLVIHGLTPPTACSTYVCTKSLPSLGQSQMFWSAYCHCVLPEYMSDSPLKHSSFTQTCMFVTRQDSLIWRELKILGIL